MRSAIASSFVAILSFEIRRVSATVDMSTSMISESHTNSFSNKIALTVAISRVPCPKKYHFYPVFHYFF